MAVISGASFDSTTLTNFFNLTLPKIEKDVRDSVNTHNVFFRYLKQLGAVKENQSGEGVYIQWEYARGGNVAARAFSDPIPLEDPDIHRTGFEPYAEYTGAIPINHTVLQKNAGPEKLIPYLDSRRKSLEKNMSYRINYDAMQGSGSFPAMTGLTTLIATTVSSGTIHGVARSTNTWIRNQQRDSTCSTTVGFGVVVQYDIEVLLKAATKGMGDRSMFKLAVMDDAIHANVAYYLPDLANSQRVVINSNASRNIPADQLKYAGENTYYLGEALAIWDHDAPSDSIRWLNPDWIQMRILKNCNFVTVNTQAEDSFNRAILLGVSCMMVNLNPKYSAVLHTFAG